MTSRHATGHRILLVVIILGGFAVRVVRLHSASLWLDELIQVYMASKPLTEMLETMFNHINLPVDIFLSRAMLSMGEQDGWLRLAPAFASTLSLPLIYAVARRLASPPTPAISMTLLAFSPLAVQYGRELRPYSLLMMLTLCSIGFFLEALRKPRYWNGFIVSALLTLHTHLFALALLPVFGVFAIIWVVRFWPSSVWRMRLLLPLAMVGLVVLVYVASPFTPDYIGRVGASVLAEPIRPDAVELATATQVQYPFPGWSELFGRLPYDFTGRFGEIALANALRWVGLALAVLGVFHLRHQRLASVFLLLWLFLIPAVILVTLSRRNHWYSPRYIIQALPAGLILLAAGLAELGGILARWRERRRKPGRGSLIAFETIAVAAVYLILAAPSLADSYNDPHENIRDAAAYIRQHYQPGDLVVAPVVGRYLDHYLPPNVRVLDTNNAALVEWTGQGYQRVFVMESKYSRLRESQAPWLAADNLLATFWPGMEIYDGPAGAEASADLDRRLASNLSSSSTGTFIPTEHLRELVDATREQKDWEKMALFLEILVARLPDDAGLRVELGYARQMLKDYDAAIAAYDEAIHLDPEHMWAHIMAANSYRLKGEPLVGLAYAQRAVELAPAQPDAWVALGNIRYSLGQLGASLQNFARALALDNKNLNAWYGYARAATTISQPDAAKAWQEVLSLDPPPAVIIEACRALGPGNHPACKSSP